MEERRLAFLAAACALLGLAALAASAAMLSASATPLTGLSIADAGRTIHACGTVASIRQRNGNYFLMLEDGASVPLVIFSSARPAGLASLSQGDHLCVAASVDEYPAGSGSIELVYRRGTFEVSDA